GGVHRDRSTHTRRPMGHARVACLCNSSLREQAYRPPPHHPSVASVIRTRLPQRQNCRTEEKPHWLVFRGGSVMITRIREVRRARGLTLDDVARRCDPRTTAQTIGRLETGTRTVPIGWRNRTA